MTLLCFLLDLRRIPSSILRDLKQCLLQLANLYVVSRESGERERSKDAIPLLRDLLGLCYIDRARGASSSPELKIAYRPSSQRFSLRDFHHAVNNLPLDSFQPDLRDSMHITYDDLEVPLKDLFSNKALYSWGSNDVSKKLIVVSLSVCMNTEALRRSLMNAAEQCVTVEFLILESAEGKICNGTSEKLSKFINHISDLENCVIQSYIPEPSVLYGLVKRWLEEVKNDIEGPLRAVFLFKNAILGSVDQISCNLFASSNQIVDGFVSCQTCRCHGHPIDITITNKTKSCCPLTCLELGASEIIENTVKVGEQTILFLPSFEGGSNLQHISAPINFDVIERTNLATLNEGVILGTSYVVTPYCHDIEASLDKYNQSDLNIQLFHGLCRALFHLDQGLVCSSACNTETMRDGTLRCYYVLQPSEKGVMLLRRLAGCEEILPIPDINLQCNLTVPEEINNSIQAALLKIDLRDYNPLQHERDFHSKINWLVKESLQFGSIPPSHLRSPKQSDPDYLNSSILKQPSSTQGSKEELWTNQTKEENSSCVTEEWEQLLIIDEMNDSYTTSCISKSRLQSSKVLTQSGHLDEKTSRILERLETPKQQKQETCSPTVSSGIISGQMKKPLVPFKSNLSQPLKPDFQRLKRKQR
ncbi:uncharacterized protein [Typha latifolia]|uniref:uncharacterized protein isoform X1 n=1 Tax=Typha latifolia TaxID=4733 RepID=UPI003C2D7BCB